MLRPILCQLLYLYTVVIIGRVIVSWFPVSEGSALATVYSVLYAITEPVLGPIRRAVPAIGMGGMGLDLSPIIVILGIQILSRAVC